MFCRAQAFVVLLSLNVVRDDGKVREAMTAAQSAMLYILCRRPAVEVATPDQEGDRVGRVTMLCLHLASKLGNDETRSKDSSELPTILEA